MWITEGFRKGDKVGRGKGQRSDLRDGGELLRSSGGKDGGRQGISGPWQGVNLRWVAEMMSRRKMEMKTKAEMVTCGEDGLAINEG